MDNVGKKRFSPGAWVSANKVTALFIVLCVGAFFASGQSMAFLLGELFTRIGRNTFLVLSLIIPVVCGLGLNFGIVIGAMAAQIGVFAISVFEMSGFGSMVVCLLVATPLAVLFGYGTGKLFNNMKGSEMIGGMVLRYCADGFYQLLFLFVFGGVIKIDNIRLMIAGTSGVKNTIDLIDSIKYVVDELPLLNVLLAVLAGTALWQVVVLAGALRGKRQALVRKTLVNIVGCGVLFACTYIPYLEKMLITTKWSLLDAVEVIVYVGSAALVVAELYGKALLERAFELKKLGARIAGLAAVYLLTYVPSVEKLLRSVKVPVFTFCLIALLCVFNQAILKTRLGQNMRTVGQSMTVASSSGINVERTRIIAIILSTVLACWGQLISLQNIGTLQTYGAHDTVGQFAIAALLVGGASVHRANNRQALLGVVLFHTLFILSPSAGKELFGNAAIGEYFRVFIAYGVIALSLAMHAWKGKGAPKIRLATPPASPGEGTPSEGNGAVPEPA